MAPRLTPPDAFLGSRLTRRGRIRGGESMQRTPPEGAERSTRLRPVELILLALLVVGVVVYLIRARRSRGELEIAAPVAADAPTNGFAVAALVLGLVGGSLLAVVFGHIALSQIRRIGQHGRGMAIAGLVLGYVGMAASVAVVIWLVATAS